MADAANAAGELSAEKVPAVTEVTRRFASFEVMAERAAAAVCSSALALIRASLAALCSLSNSSNDFMRPGTARLRPNACV